MGIGAALLLRGLGIGVPKGTWMEEMGKACIVLWVLGQLGTPAGGVCQGCPPGEVRCSWGCGMGRGVQR